MPIGRWSSRRGWSTEACLEPRLVSGSPWARNRLTQRRKTRQVHLTHRMEPTTRRPNAVGSTGRPYRAGDHFTVHHQRHRAQFDAYQQTRQRIAAREGRRHALHQAGERGVVEEVQPQDTRPRGRRGRRVRPGRIARRELREVDRHQPSTQRQSIGADERTDSGRYRRRRHWAEQPDGLPGRLAGGQYCEQYAEHRPRRARTALVGTGLQGHQPTTRNGSHEPDSLLFRGRQRNSRTGFTPALPPPRATPSGAPPGSASPRQWGPYPSSGARPGPPPHTPRPAPPAAPAGARA